MKRFTIEDRMLIQACLTKGMTLTDIAFRLKKNKSSISREISSHIEIRTGYALRPCIHKSEYFVCNACPIRERCGHEKRYYNFEKANDEAEDLKKISRSRTRLTKQEIRTIDNILIDQVRSLKQSLHHVYESNPTLMSICSEKTIRRLIYRHEVSLNPHELRKYVVYKHSYEKPKSFQLRDISILIGRQYNDFINFVKSHKRMNIAQYDSVIGKTSDGNAILTITFPKYEFQFGLLIKKNNPNDVVAKLKRLFRFLGSELVKKIFQINLADNGIEFSYFNKIECDDNGEFICRTFFTRPYKATDKPHCERYHEFIRYMIPKGKSLDFLTQEKVDWMFSQINSYIRESLGNKTPYELIERKYGKEFLDAINIKKVPKREVDLKQIC